MTLGILYREDLKEYDFGQGHPFRGDRFDAFYHALRSNLTQGIDYRIVKSDPATDDDLFLICNREYINFTREFYRAASRGLTGPGDLYRFHSADNTPLGKPGKIEEAARFIVGQAKEACRLVQEGFFQKVISVGGGLHHARRSRGEGFCLYNDVAYCALHLIKKYGMERVLILDTDAHAGNGTCEYFYDDPRVLFIDLHQDPLTIYPGTGFAGEVGRGEGKGFTINVPMPVGAGYESFQMVFDTIVEPVTMEFKPQIIIRNGGSDPHFKDGLTSLGLPLEGFFMIGQKVRQMAEVCDDKVIDLVCSGYNKDVLPHAWLAIAGGLAGIKLNLKEVETDCDIHAEDVYLTKTKEVIEDVKANHRDYWSCLG